MTLALISLLPVVIYLIVLKLMDSFSLVKWRYLVFVMAYGAAAAVLALFLSEITGGLVWSGISLAPLVEEILKAGVIVYATLKKNLRFMVEALIYGAAAGGGFALVENTAYLLANSDMMVGTAIFRGFGCAILHIGCTALFSNLLIFLFIKSNKGLITFCAIIPSVIIHYLHNYIDVSPVVKLFAVLLVFYLLFVILFQYGERKIYRWMDRSISGDVQTLSSVRKGDFSSTNAGKYLLNVKDQFEPEVFFDMICCVELSLEIKIERQSRMLMSQAGFDSGQSEESKAKIDEFNALKARIGKTGCQVLAPLIRDVC